MSLRARVLLGLAVIAAVLVIAASVIIRTTQSYLVAQVDDQLTALAGPQGEMFGSGRRPTPPSGTVQQFPERLSPLYTGVVVNGAVEMIQEPNFSTEGSALPAIDAEQATAAAASHEPFTASSPDGSAQWRVRASSTRDGVVIVSALPLDDTDAAVRRLVALEIGATALALGVLALVAWWVIRLGVRPINDMAEAAEAIAAGDLSHRVPEVDPSTEAGKLGVALNQMLGRIEETFDERTRTDERLRRFVADASHELRTPVTTIRGYAELYRAGALPPGDELDDAMRRTEEEAIRMGSLVEDMLQLARLDQGRPLDSKPVDLASLARDAAADARAVRPGRTITATVGDDTQIVVLGDSDRLRQVIANLVGNALVHTADDAAVEIQVERRGRDAVLEVTDHGAGMAPEVAQRAFERFFRADPSRSRHQGGSGLGLSIVQAVVAAHGGHIELKSVLGEGTTVRVVLPVTGAAPTPPPVAPAPAEPASA